MSRIPRPRGMSGAAPESPERPRSADRIDSRRRLRRAAAGSARLTRTILLGAVAVVAAIAWLARELGLDRLELLSYLRTSVMLVAGLVVLGLLAGLLLWGARVLRGRCGRPGS
jgi:protein-S-isoprenylcysteine O-methyltransferase Ste14